MRHRFFVGTVIVMLFFGGAGCAENDLVENQDSLNVDTQIVLPPITKAQVVGNWTVLSNDAFQEITLHEDGTYETYLYEKPFIDGTWILEDTTLTLKATPGQEFDATYTIQSITNNQMSLTTDTGTSLWQSLKQ